MWQNSVSVLKVLRKYKTDVNLADYEGRTPVSYGVEQIDLVKYLVKECGADINQADHAGHTPLWYAKSKCVEPSKGIDVVKELTSLGAKE